MGVTTLPSCLTRIKSMYSMFSEKEKKIADYILDDPQEIIHSTINQVADDLDIADATVFRFCKRIGFKGYQAMKISLASEIVSPIQDIHEAITEDDDEVMVTEKVFNSNIQSLNDSLHLINKENIIQAVEAVLKSPKVDFYGSGGSGIVALDAHHKFLRSGITTAAYQDTHLQLLSAAQLTYEDTVFLISHSGTNKDLLEILDVVKETGATTIGITNYAKTPLAEKVDIPLYTTSKETLYRSEALSSRIAQLSLIDAIFVNIMIKREKESKESLQKIRKAISLKRI